MDSEEAEGPKIALIGSQAGFGARSVAGSGLDGRVEPEAHVLRQLAHDLRSKTSAIPLRVFSTFGRFRLRTRVDARSRSDAGPVEMAAALRAVYAAPVTVSRQVRLRLNLEPRETDRHDAATQERPLHESAQKARLREIAGALSA